MTNIDRAARMVWDASRAAGEPLSAIASDYIAAALADATPPLLLPDLPEPDGFSDWDMDPLVVRIDTATRDVCLEDPDPYEGRAIYMSPDEARGVALSLIAAANDAERNQS
ncbi:hypothetical protein [Corynebacterium sp.]|uniref:hypothetical protein n=1 Tax=Corynebacterium sp. TaxID=1720 RepID=UPI0028AE2FCA|nr:hypothetical protein [Corynebacterium sp.]